MAHSAIMSVRITGNADDAVKAFEKTTTKAAAFGSAIGGLAVKGVTALWDTVKGFASDVVNMSDSTDKFMNTMSFAGIDTKAVQAAAKETRKYADATVYGLDDIQNTTAQLAANGIGNYMELTEAAGNLNAVMAANPIMLVITLIAALVAGLTYFFACTNTGKAVWSSFTGFLSGCVQGIIGFFSGLGSTIVGIFNSAANGARNAWNGVVGWFRGLPGSIAGCFGNAGSILYNAGASIISGFLNGLKSMWSNVTGWVSGIGDWIKEHKGPPAYDAIMLVNNGRLIMKGFARGLRTGFDTDVRRTIGSINGRLSNVVFNGGTTAGSQAASTTTVFNVTFNAPVDREGVAREIRKILRDYDRKRGN